MLQIWRWSKNLWLTILNPQPRSFIESFIEYAVEVAMPNDELVITFYRNHIGE